MVEAVKAPVYGDNLGSTPALVALFFFG